jgi:uncharacterized protein
MWACRNRHTHLVELLLQHGAEVGKTNVREGSGDGGNTALWFTAQGATPGNVPIARLLLDHGATPDVRCEHGTTALFMAASWGHIGLVQLLIERGANATIRNLAGQTPLESVQSDLAWASRQEVPDGDVRRFLERAPRIIAFLANL